MKKPCFLYPFYLLALVVSPFAGARSFSFATQEKETTVPDEGVVCKKSERNQNRPTTDTQQENINTLERLFAIKPMNCGIIQNIQIQYNKIRKDRSRGGIDGCAGEFVSKLKELYSEHSCTYFVEIFGQETSEKSDYKRVCTQAARNQNNQNSPDQRKNIQYMEKLFSLVNLNGKVNCGEVKTLRRELAYIQKNRPKGKGPGYPLDGCLGEYKAKIKEYTKTCGQTAEPEDDTDNEVPPT